MDKDISWGANFLKMGAMLFQWGTHNSNAAGAVQAFPFPFAATPHIMVSSASANGFNGYVRFKISGSTKSQIGEIFFFDTGGTPRSNEQVNWIAIGHV